MDAVVCAVRILSDPDLRLQYDDIRTERTQLHNHPDRDAARQSTASPYSAMSGSTVTHKNRSSSGTASPSSTLLLSLLTNDAIPDAVSSMATVSTTGDNHDPADTSNTASDYLSVHESVNGSNILDSTINSYHSTAAVLEADLEDAPASLSASNHPSSNFIKNGANDDNSGHITKSKSRSGNDTSNPIPLTSPGGRINQVMPPAQMKSALEPPGTKPPLVQKNWPATQQTQQTLQRRVRSGETINTYGDGSLERSYDSTLFYDNDEDETFFTMEEDDDSFEPRHRRRSTTQQSCCIFEINPFSCLDHRIDRIRDEMIDAIDDTVNALEQVMNVFTIQEDDIAAVRSRIEKAKRQVVNVNLLQPHQNLKVANVNLLHPHQNINVKGRNCPDLVCGDDTNVENLPNRSSYSLTRRKAKPFVLPPPPSSITTRRIKKVMS
jgi:hypothetical protein